MWPIVVVISMVLSGVIEAAEINCEKVDHFNEYTNCCYLNETTKISENNFVIAGLKNPDVDAIFFSSNENVEFLPLNIFRKFPNLEAYVAKNTSVKEISALNFVGLIHLKLLDLRRNKIEFIPNYCFEDLISLNSIYLSSNKIVTMNGNAFANLPQLVRIDLLDNVCFDKYYWTERSLKIFHRKISRNCGSNNLAQKEISCEISNACDEEMEGWFFQWYQRSAACCHLKYGTVIESPDYSLNAKENYTSREVFSIAHQRNVEFLPVSIHEKFPNLKFYSVVDTPTKKITKKNFEKLFQLEMINFKFNQIEVIKSDTFEDLVSLKEIYLSWQRLTSMNGQIFMNLNELRSIDLAHNYCIDKEFFFNAIKAAPEEITKSCGFEEFDVIEIQCEKFQNSHQNYDICVMIEQTAINDTNFVVGDPKDDETEAIDFHDNKKIEYLPYKIYMQFPNLFIYYAKNCSIRKITQENFEKLYFLKAIDLSSNKIQQVSGNTFKGLESLGAIDLSDNQIKSVNGRAFDHLPMLKGVDLRNNECVDIAFRPGDQSKPDCADGEQSSEENECVNKKPNVERSIENFKKKIIQNCAFSETGVYVRRDQYV